MWFGGIQGGCGGFDLVSEVAESPDQVLRALRAVPDGVRWVGDGVFEVVCDVFEEGFCDDAGVVEA